MSGYKRISIDVAEDLHDTLERHAARQGITVAELLRRAVALHLFVDDHQQPPEDGLPRRGGGPTHGRRQSPIIRGAMP